jgi:hypothetical protein
MRRGETACFMRRQAREDASSFHSCPSLAAVGATVAVRRDAQKGLKRSLTSFVSRFTSRKSNAIFVSRLWAKRCEAVASRKPRRAGASRRHRRRGALCTPRDGAIRSLYTHMTICFYADEIHPHKIAI